MFLKILICCIAILSITTSARTIYNHFNISGAPPYDTSEDETQLDDSNPLSWLQDWRRPEGPPRVGLQAGHWKNSELPDELERLRGNTGSSGGGKSEWQVNLDIANLTADLLRAKGIQVDILPSTIPKSYWADAFVAIHADGNLDTTISGFKISPPRRDYSGKAQSLTDAVYTTYQQATGISIDPNVSKNMRGYYAFSWRRFTHAIHPMTPGIIVETGFLTSPADRRIIVNSSAKSAQGIAHGIINFLAQNQLI